MLSLVLNKLDKKFNNQVYKEILKSKKNFTEYTSSRMTVDIKEGDLLIFPAWLLHGVLSY